MVFIYKGMMSIICHHLFVRSIIYIVSEEMPPDDDFELPNAFQSSASQDYVTLSTDSENESVSSSC